MKMMFGSSISSDVFFISREKFRLEIRETFAMNQFSNDT
jgi:hypothetical protein